MILFDNVEYDNFFNPLYCKNKRIYYECILQLIEKSKSVPLLYESDARDTLILYLRNCSYAFGRHHRKELWNSSAKIRGMSVLSVDMKANSKAWYEMVSGK